VAWSSRCTFLFLLPPHSPTRATRGRPRLSVAPKVVGETRHSRLLPLACHLPLPLLQRFHSSLRLLSRLRNLRSFPRPSVPFRGSHQPSSLSRSHSLRACSPIHAPPLTEVPPYPFPSPPSHPPPPLTTLPVPTTVAVGTAGVPLALSPPTRPSPVSFFDPQVEPAPTPTIAHRTRSSHPAPLTTTPAPTSPTFVPTPNVRGERYEGTLRGECPLVDSPHESAHWGGDISTSPHHIPPPPSPPTHGERRVSGDPPPKKRAARLLKAACRPHTPPPHPPSPHPHHLVGRNVWMRFGSRWYRGVVTDHDVSTDAELIWHVVFDDGDECDLNLVELLPNPSRNSSPPHSFPVPAVRDLG
jgi:hypothetical protein